VEFHQWPLAYRLEEQITGIGPAPDGGPDTADLDRPAEALLCLLGHIVQLALVACGPRSIMDALTDAPIRAAASVRLYSRSACR
jgi:hypothetical protein